MVRHLEVCCDSLQSVHAALDGGPPSRLELCSSLEVGGLSPSYGFVETVFGILKRKGLDKKVKIMALIRPRAGDFCYSSEEIDMMIRNCKILKSVGASGFVFGCLTPDGYIDKDGMARLLDVCEELGKSQVTFCRASKYKS